MNCRNWILVYLRVHVSFTLNGGQELSSVRDTDRRSSFTGNRYREGDALVRPPWVQRDGWVSGTSSGRSRESLPGRKKKKSRTPEEPYLSGRPRNDSPSLKGRGPLFPAEVLPKPQNENKNKTVTPHIPLSPLKETDYKSQVVKHRTPTPL